MDNDKEIKEPHLDKIYDFFKHLTSLNTVAILIMIAFSNKLSAHAVFIKKSFTLFVTSLICSFALMLVIIGYGYVFLPQRQLSRSESVYKNVMNIVIMIFSIISTATFVIGITFLVRFVKTSL